MNFAAAEFQVMPSAPGFIYRIPQRKLITPMALDLTPEFKYPPLLVPMYCPDGSPFISDLASIPWWARRFPNSDTENASIPHDFLCRYGYLLTARSRRLYIDRRTADKIFHQMLLHDNVNNGRAYAMYMALYLKTTQVNLWAKF